MFIFDTVGCISDERRVMSGFCESLWGGETGIIVLGKDVRELPWLMGREEAVFLPDPFDPDRLAAVAEGMFSGPRKGNVEADRLESDLKDFLRLS